MKANKSIIFHLFIVLIYQFTFGQKESPITASQVINNYFEAIGGMKRAEQIKSISMEAVGLLKKHPIYLEKKLLLPNKSYHTLQHKDQLISKSVFDGKKGKIFETGSFRKFTKNEILAASKKRSIFPEFNYFKEAKYIGIREVNAVKCHLLKIGDTKVYYDVESGLKIKGSSIRNKGTTKFTQHLYFDNYINIEGVKMPSQLSIEVGNRKIKFQTKTLLINQNVAPKDFK
ncbi:MAG: hypothetical protein ACPHXR_05020 [Flavicella sp.]